MTVTVERPTGWETYRRALSQGDAAAAVDDPEMYTDFISWMAGILEARGVPRPALAAGIAVTGEAVEEVLGDGERPLRFLALAAGLLDT